MIDQSDFGPVRVTGGKHKGKVGYYDDDDWDLDGKAIVYFGEPLKSEYALIPYRFLERHEDAALPLEKFVRENPQTAKRFGIVGSRK